MIIFFSSHSGGSNWYVGPFIMFILPYLLNGGVDQLRALLHQVVKAVQAHIGYQLSAASNWWWCLGLLCILALGLVVGILTQVSVPRVMRLLWQVLFQGISGGSEAAAAAARGGRGQPRGRQQQAAQQRQQRWDRVVHALQQLPTAVIETREQLEQLSSAQLKSRLRQQGINCSNCLEKRELVSQLLQAGGSSGSGCSICCEDYTAGDVVRVLPCKHRYHIECVDKWFLSSTDYSREPACPMCNASLLQADES